MENIPFLVSLVKPYSRPFFLPWKILITILSYRSYQTALFARRLVILGCTKVQFDKNEPPIEVLRKNATSKSMAIKGLFTFIISI